jgi:hypothetical protein
MNIRRQVFASEFSSEFEKILQREIANSDVLGKCRVSGVLVARGLVAVLLVACYRALRHALMARKHCFDNAASGSPDPSAYSPSREPPAAKAATSRSLGEATAAGT